jgi:hypothetical protein
VFDPEENRVGQVLGRGGKPRETIEDPVLASWLFGESWVAGQAPWVKTFTIWRSGEPPARAWLVPWTAIPEPHLLDDWSGDPREILAVLEHAVPITVESTRPEEWTIPIETREDAWLIVSQLADPQWKAELIGPDRRRAMPAPILSTFRKANEPGGWQRVDIPGPGRWTLRLEYEAHDIAHGLAISTMAWIVWIVLALACALQPLRNPRSTARRTEGAQVQPGPSPRSGSASEKPVST